jgi:HAMP domain-containing protein
MRGKLIAVFAVVVLVVGGLSYALTRATLGDLSTPGETPRALAGASAQLQVDGLVLERWLAGEVTNPKLREPFNAGTESARFEGARLNADKLREAAVSSKELGPLSVQLVALVDKNGKVLARNGSALMRGDDLGGVYPTLRDALKKGGTGSDVWVNRARNEQMLTSYAGIREADGSIIGAVVVGTALNDERLNIASDRTSGRMIAAAVRDGDKLEMVAKSNGVTPELLAALITAPAKDGAFQALSTGQVVDLGGMPREYVASARALEGYGNGSRLVLISLVKLSAPAILSGLIWPALGATLLGLILVIVGAYFLDAYISRPVSEIEDGLLAIMNGRTDRRFEIEHAELGGLVFRLNSLLNQLFGVQEDETDEQGRPSRAPEAASFQDALSVDERMAAMGTGDTADAQALRDEPEDAYYRRIFEEYIKAKRELGDPVDHIGLPAFVERIMASEKELADKHGKPVRYKVEVRGREVVLLAVPLG